MPTEFIGLNEAAKRVAAAHDAAGVRKPTREEYYNREGAKLPRTANPLSVDLITLGNAMRTSLGELRQRDGYFLALTSHYNESSVEPTFWSDSLFKLRRNLRSSTARDPEWTKSVISSIRETLIYLCDRDAKELWPENEPQANRIGNYMRGGVCTSTAYLYGAVDLIEAYKEKLDLTATEQISLLGQICEFYYEFATASTRFENFFQARFLANFDHTLEALAEEFAIFFYDRLVIQRNEDGIPSILIDAALLKEAGDNFVRAPGERRGCSAYFAGLLRPFLDWSKDVVGALIFADTDRGGVQEA